MMREIKELEHYKHENAEIAVVIEKLNEAIRLLNDHEMRVGHATKRV